MTEDALLVAIAENPRELTPQLALADYYAELGDRREVAWRWIAAFRRRPWLPYDPHRFFHTGIEIVEPAGWGNWTFTGMDWPWSAGWGMLPSEVYKWLPTVGRVRGTWYERVVYPSPCRAYEALVSAFLRATKPRWVLAKMLFGSAWEPNWDLVSRVPEDLEN